MAIVAFDPEIGKSRNLSRPDIPKPAEFEINHPITRLPDYPIE
ncbi:MAG: hypothetical protein ACE14M_08145 [Terriglobales bacterium]